MFPTFEKVNDMALKRLGHGLLIGFGMLVIWLCWNNLFLLIAKKDVFLSLVLMALLVIGMIGMWRGILFFKAGSWVFFGVLFLGSVWAMHESALKLPPAVINNDSGWILFYAILGTAGAVGIGVVLHTMGLHPALAIIAVVLLIVIWEFNDEQSWLIFSLILWIVAVIIMLVSVEND